MWERQLCFGPGDETERMKAYLKEQEKDLRRQSDEHLGMMKLNIDLLHKAEKEMKGLREKENAIERCIVCGAPEPCSHDFDKERERLHNLGLKKRKSE